MEIVDDMAWHRLPACVPRSSQTGSLCQAFQTIFGPQKVRANGTNQLCPKTRANEPASFFAFIVAFRFCWRFKIEQLAKEDFAPFLLRRVGAGDQFFPCRFLESGDVACELLLDLFSGFLQSIRLGIGRFPDPQRLLFCRTHELVELALVLKNTNRLMPWILGVVWGHCRDHSTMNRFHDQIVSWSKLVIARSTIRTGSQSRTRFYRNAGRGTVARQKPPRDDRRIRGAISDHPCPFAFCLPDPVSFGPDP